MQVLGVQTASCIQDGDLPGVGTKRALKLSHAFCFFVYFP